MTQVTELSILRWPSYFPKPIYDQAGHRYIMYPMPSRFDDWGYDAQGNRWEYSFCVMDDYGNAVPVDPWPHRVEGEPVWIPEPNQEIKVGEPCKYILHYPTVH